MIIVLYIPKQYFSVEAFNILSKNFASQKNSPAVEACVWLSINASFYLNIVGFNTQRSFETAVPLFWKKIKHQYISI